MSYVEDGPPVLPLNTAGLSITDEETVQLRRAILTIENTDTAANDQLYASLSSTFVLTGNGTTELIIDPSPGREFLTTQDQFEEYLRTVWFVTDDQAPYIVRNLTLVVGKVPNALVTSSPAVIPISVIGVNDRPVLLSSQMSEAALDNYIPQEVNNLGFSPSDLLSETDVMDVDRNSPITRDIIGLAITGYINGGVGRWQYWYKESWVDFPPSSVSDCSPLLINITTRVRFRPIPNFSKEDGNASIVYRAWDGTGNTSCENGTLNINEGK